MSLQDQPPKLINANWQQWAQRTATWLARTRSTLRHKLTGESAAEDGVLLWDPVRTDPVISVNGEYVHIVLEGGYGSFTNTTDHNLAAINTATAVDFDTINLSDDISLNAGGDRVIFSHSGVYSISFSTQITSGSGSLKTVWFWPRVNGVDVAGSTIKVSIKDNSTTTVMSRTAVFTLSDNDYLQVMWAADSTNVKLEAAPATAFAPSTPSAILTASRIRQL